MSSDWPTGPEDADGTLAFIAVLFVLFVTLLLGGNRRREGSIRLAGPAFVPLDADNAQQVASELGAAFREYMGAERRRGGNR